MGGHTLWTRDRDTYYALGGLFYHRRGRPRPEPGTYRRMGYGRTITVGMVNLPYGRAVAKQITDRSVTHATDRIGFAWMGGRVVGAMSLWLCGGRTTEFELSDQVSSRWCAICWLRLNGLTGGNVVINIDSLTIRSS